MFYNLIIQLKGSDFVKRNEKGQFIKGENVKDLTNKRFGKLKVIMLDKERAKRKSYWICECECGNVKSIRGDTLKVIKSCGCVKKEQDLINLGITYNHGMTYHPVFSIWNAMMERCYNKNQRSYKDYGGRGIEVCEEWHDAKKFCDWADKSGFKKGYSIERVNVNGNYEPSNCEWIPKGEQTWNTRKTVYVEIDGKNIPLAKTARKLGLKPCLVWHRWNSGVREYDKLFFKGNLHTEYKG